MVMHIQMIMLYVNVLIFWGYRLNENAKYRPRCIGLFEQGHDIAYFDGQLGVADDDIACTQNWDFYVMNHQLSEIKMFNILQRHSSFSRMYYLCVFLLFSVVIFLYKVFFLTKYQETEH